MPTYDLEGNRTGLPHTKRGGLPYEIEAFGYRRRHTPRGNSVEFTAKQLWRDAPLWAKYMVGEVSVVVDGSTPRLSRQVPEFRNARDRELYCTAVEYATSAGRPLDGLNHADPLENFPATRRVSGGVTFEDMLWDVHDDASAGVLVTAAQSSTAGYGGVRELYRYLQRMQKAYSAEQRIPAASDAGGFKVVDDAVSANRLPIGQVAFRTVSMADVVYKWMRVPLGWPPPKGWAPPGGAPYWPPRVNPVSTLTPENFPARDRFKGTVNSEYWDVGPIRGYAWAPETLLYVGYDDSNQYTDAAGVRCCDYVFNFKYKEGGWNKFLSARGEWVRVSLDGTSSGTQPYAESDFNYLFEYQA